MTRGEELSLSEARRLALAAQGFDRPRPKSRVGAGELRAVLRQLGLIQIDYVNVLVPAHYQVPFSRLGAYPRPLLDRVVYGGREFTEQWAHEAAIAPMEIWPLLRHRRASHRVRPYGFESFLGRHAEYVARVLEDVRSRGPLSADQVAGPDGRDRRIPGAWFGSIPRAVLEAHFGRGELAVVRRRPNGARVFDLAERVIPERHYARDLGIEAEQRELLLRAARAHGVATASDLADYYRLSMRRVRPRLDELVAAGELRSVRVAGWREPAYRPPKAESPRRLDAAALLSPFDPVVWCRARIARLFDFEYTIEIFVPQPKRRWGYYVLPFLLGERLVARVDLKADRAGRRLQVLAAHLEAGLKAADVAPPLAAELATMAGWLGLESVAVEARGALGRALTSAVREA